MKRAKEGKGSVEETRGNVRGAGEVGEGRESVRRG